MLVLPFFQIMKNHSLHFLGHPLDHLLFLRIQVGVAFEFKVHMWLLCAGKTYGHAKNNLHHHHSRLSV